MCVFSLFLLKILLSLITFHFYKPLVMIQGVPPSFTGSRTISFLPYGLYFVTRKQNDDLHSHNALRWLLSQKDVYLSVTLFFFLSFQTVFFLGFSFSSGFLDLCMFLPNLCKPPWTYFYRISSWHHFMKMGQRKCWNFAVMMLAATLYPLNQWLLLLLTTVVLSDGWLSFSMAKNKLEITFHRLGKKQVKCVCVAVNRPLISIISDGLSVFTLWKQWLL